MGKRILIVNVNWVGDIIFSTPFIRAVRDAHPDSYIACLVHPRCKEMLYLNPRINDIIVYDEKGRHRGFFGKIPLVMELRRRKFDTAFILHRSFTKSLLAYLAGIKERIGYPTKNRAFILTKTVEEPSHEVHKVEYFLNIARACRIPVKDASYEFFVNDANRDFIDGFLKRSGADEKKPLVVICPGGNWDPKRWPGENFARLSDIIADKFNADIAIAGAKKDEALAMTISDMMKHKPIITCGQTTLTELGALLEKARLVIANDTGPMHMAVAMKTRVIALFGPTSPKLTGPYGKGNYKVISKHEECDIPCYDVTCKKNRCMEAIKVEDVLKVVEEMI